MAEFLVVIDNADGDLLVDESEHEALKRTVFPDNVPHQHVETVVDSTVQFFVFNSRGAIIEDDSACFGHLCRPSSGWSKPRESKPDGSYSIVRNDDRYTEALTDIVASRTVWYVITDEYAIISSRQRPIVYLKESFVPNEDASTWMITSGHLGPWNSWDEEIAMLPPDSRLLIDRQQWEFDVEQTLPDFTTETTDKKQLMADIDRTLTRTFDSFDVHPEKDVLTLSGGYDSRAVTHYLSRDHSLRTLTWGHPDALTDPTTDATIAADLADFYDTEHTYMELNLSEISSSPKTVLDRFVAAGEGRIDHLSGYIDGLKIFEELASSEVERMIRSDHGYGVGAASPATPFTTDRHTRWVVGVSLPQDYESLPISGKGTDLLPAVLEKGQHDSIAEWRGHLRQGVRIPNILGALTSIKTPYLELCNPLLTRSVIQQARSIPSNLRAEKRLFKDFVLSLNSDYPIAESSALLTTESLLRSPPVVDFLAEYLHEQDFKTVNDEIVSYALEHLATGTPEFSTDDGFCVRSFARDHLPRHVTDLLRRFLNDSQHMDPNRLAFRLYIIGRINDELQADSTTRT